MTDIVHIINPKGPLAKPARTTQEAFGAVWEAKGWKILSPQDAAKREIEYAKAHKPKPAEPAKPTDPAKTGGAA